MCQMPLVQWGSDPKKSCFYVFVWWRNRQQKWVKYIILPYTNKCDKEKLADKSVMVDGEGCNLKCCMRELIFENEIHDQRSSRDGEVNLDYIWGEGLYLTTESVKFLWLSTIKMLNPPSLSSSEELGLSFILTCSLFSFFKHMSGRHVFSYSPMYGKKWSSIR